MVGCETAAVAMPPSVRLTPATIRANHRRNGERRSNCFIGGVLTVLGIMLFDSSQDICCPLEFPICHLKSDPTPACFTSYYNESASASMVVNPNGNSPAACLNTNNEQRERTLGPKARLIPAWGNAPGIRVIRNHERQQRDSSGSTKTDAELRDDMGEDGTGLQPWWGWRCVSWSVALGWFEDAPLALVSWMRQFSASGGCPRRCHTLRDFRRFLHYLR